MAVNGVRFGHVAFRTADVERSVSWYGNAFGAKKIYHAEAKGERPELMFLEFARGQLVEFFTNGKSKSKATDDAVGYMHFCLVVDDLKQALAHLLTMNVRPDRGPFVGRANQLIAFITDPDGNVIELMEIPPDSPIYRN